MNDKKKKFFLICVRVLVNGRGIVISDEFYANHISFSFFKSRFFEVSF